MIGVRAGLRAGGRCGVAAGVSADPIKRRNTDPLSSVTRDATSGWYFPANATEWTTLAEVAELPEGGPSSAWLCQEPSGNLADSVSSVTLSASGAGHLYQQAVAGFSRKAIQCVDGTAGQKWINSTTAPDPNALSVLYLAAISFPAAPAAARCLFANSGSLDCRMASTGRLTIINGASTTGTTSHASGVHLVLLQYNMNASTFTCFTDLEKISGTFGAVASNPMFVLGGQTAVPAGAAYLYSAVWADTAAEITSTQAKSLIATMTGITPPWAP